MAEIDLLAAYLSSKKWCDCEILETDGDLVLLGRTSFEQHPDIVLTFKEFSYASIKKDWQFDFETAIMSLIEDDESKSLNQIYEIEKGNHVFKLYAEDITRPFIIIAKSFVVKIVG